MPPPSIPTGSPHLSRHPHSSLGFTQLSNIFLLALFVAACLRCVIVYQSRRKSPTETPRLAAIDKASISCRVVPEKDPRQLQYPDYDDNRSDCHGTGENNAGPPTFRPIYPWIAPPAQLPGPYDPRLYPLPTIRRHSYANPSTAAPSENDMISYTRRVSTTSIPTRQTTIQGTVTTSSHGWRRNQWVVSGG